MPLLIDLCVPHSIDTKLLVCPFKLHLDLPPYTRLSPQSLLQQLAIDIQSMKHDIAQLRQDIQTFQEPSALKAWLKGYKIPKWPSIEDLDDIFFFDDFDPHYRYK